MNKHTIKISQDTLKDSNIEVPTDKMPKAISKPESIKLKCILCDQEVVFIEHNISQLASVISGLFVCHECKTMWKAIREQVYDCIGGHDLPC